jgi:PAS domain S-box-containing protein
MTGMTVLVADDDPGVLNVLEEMFQPEGYRVLLAQNGKEAVETAKNQTISVAILDLRMPVMDGLEAMRCIKEIDQGTQVLIMTAHADFQSLSQSLIEYGAFDYLLKPFYKEEAIEAVRNAILKKDYSHQRDFNKKEWAKNISQLEKDYEKRTLQLRELQVKYKEIVDNFNDMIVVVQDKKLKFANHKTLDLMGYTQDEILDIPFIDMVHPEDQEMVRKRHVSLLEGGKFATIYPFRLLRKNKEDFWAESNGIRTIWEWKPAVLLFIKDISESKRVEGALKASEKKYSSLVENSPDIIYVLDHEGNFTFAGGAIKNLLGFTAEDLIGKYFSCIIWPEDLEKARWHFNERRTGERATRMLELRLKTKQRQVTPFDICDLAIELDAFGMYNKPVSEKDKKFLGTYGVARDISRRKQIEEALRESEEKYRMLVENANDAIFIVQDNVVKFPNPKTEQLTGYSTEELAKIPVYKFIHPEDRHMVLGWGRRRIAGDNLPGIYSCRIIDRSGEELWVQINLVPINWEGRPAALNFIRDITQERKLEAQFQQAQKMEAIGTLAGGVAHDFNNLLTSIQGSASLMLLETDRDHPHYRILQDIEKQVQSGAKLTKQLLGYARKGKYEVKPFNLNRLVEETSETFGRTRKEINIHRDLAENLFLIEGDDRQIEQVLLNLYVNAADAMPAGGDLFLKTMNVVDKEMGGNVAKPGNWVLLIIRDTGIGMDKKIQERIFEPFFTTKERGKGTGLGLASVYGIIKAHGGYIDIDSIKGQGTTFSIFLPESKMEFMEEKKVHEEIISGSGTILLVDDEEMILDIGDRLLKELGYNVLVAESGEKALAIYNQNQDKIELVILDMIMPGMGGGEVYDRVKQLNPNAKVLLCSGYTMDAKTQQIIKKGVDGFIPKPFNMRLLSKKIREILDKEKS